MVEIVCKKVSEALIKSQDYQLSDELWVSEHKEKNVNRNDSEYISWTKSLPILLNLINEAGFGENKIVFEYPSIGTGGRIDAVLIGKDSARRDVLIPIELKQWSFTNMDKIEENKDLTVIPVQISEGEVDYRRHPFIQLSMYINDLKECNSLVKTTPETQIHPLLFLHNCLNPEILVTGTYQAWSTKEEYVNGLFGKNDGEKLKSYLKTILSSESNHDFADAFVKAKYMLTPADLTGLTKVFKQKENAIMIQDQKDIDIYVQQLIRSLKKGKLSKKQMVIVSGQPGTGKTILGLHFLYDYARIYKSENYKANNLPAAFAIPRSKTIHEVIRWETKMFIPYLGNQLSDNLDILIIDEAHRITNPDELKLAFNKAKIVILLQDNRQRVAPDELGTVDNFKFFASNNNIDVHVKQLSVQKRSGFQGNITSAIDKLLYENKPCPLDTSLNVKIFDSLLDMEEQLKSDLEQFPQNRNRFLASFDWSWSRNTAKNDISILDGNNHFEKPWNPYNGQQQAQWYWESGLSNMVNLVGCIYTCQGLEFDNVGFIWGPDFRWDKNRNNWVFDIDKLRDMLLKKKLVNVPNKVALEIIKNIYRVLLTRATKGMGIFFCDEDTKNHVQQYLNLERKNY